MKNLLCLFAVSALLCGCQKADPKVAALESKLNAIQTHLAALDEQLATMSSLQTNNFNMLLGIATNAPFDPISATIDPATGLPNPLFQIGDRVDNLTTTVSNLIIHLNNSRSGARFTVAQPAAAPGQIPADVLAGIRADAARRHPGDFDTQIYVIKMQTEAWYRLHQ